ncbi:MAG: hypothetical protein U5P41_07470 [Gammaproteobacteria bacterium]|nr:hypothetical protein [Gammaproteobacteria bacterium]
MVIDLRVGGEDDYLVCCFREEVRDQVVPVIVVEAAKRCVDDEG